MAYEHNFGSFLASKMEGRFGDMRLANELNATFSPEFVKVSRSTIRNWRDQTSPRAKKWQQLLAVGHILGLDEFEIDELLSLSKFPKLAELWEVADEEEQAKLLSLWSRVPFNLPRKNPFFVGRVKEKSELLLELSKAQHNFIYCLTGMAGVGKTTLAIELAYEAKERRLFSQGIIWLDGRRNTIEELLLQCGFQLGRNLANLRNINLLSQAVREMLSSKKLLLIIDNLNNEKDLELLLPATGFCAVLVSIP
ncbi:MAG: ATP-binding protein [Chloroflexota bacterium]